MEKKRRRGLIQALIMIIMAAAIAVILIYMIPERHHLNDEVVYQVDPSVTDNPLIGFAPPAENVDECSRTNLVFIRLRWADWEPQEGKFDTDYLRETFHIDEYSAQNKHCVLRFVCDIPGEEQHTDIPEWVMEKTGGQYYTNEYGSGCMPSYSNPEFIRLHERAVKELAKFFDGDDFLSYVELGSLGHWGEWHCMDSEGRNCMPEEETLWDYVLPYTDNFTNSRILMRRSYQMAGDGGLGLYNDILGDSGGTGEWLSWTNEGGQQELSKGNAALVPMEDFWKKAPAGGEFSSELSPEELMNTGLGDILEELDKCHVSFIGPNCALYDPEYSAGYEALKKRIGYRIYISRLETKFKFAENAIEVSLEWKNDGNAPIYWDWPVMLKVFDSEGNPVYWESLDINLSELVPGTVINTKASIPFTDEIKEGFSIGIMAVDYEEDETLTLAIEYDDENSDESGIPSSMERIEGAQIVYRYVKNQKGS